MKLKLLTLVLLLSLLARPMLFASDVASLTEEQNKLKKEIEEVTDKILEYEDEINKIKDEVAKNDQKIKDLEAKQVSNRAKIEESRNSLDETMVMMQKVNNTNTLTTYFYDEEAADNNYFLKLENINLMFDSVAGDMKVFVDEIKAADSDIKEIKSLEKINEDKLKEVDKKIEEQVKLEGDLKEQLAEIELEIGKVALSTSGPASGSEKEAIMSAAGISSSDYQYVDYIITKESGWNATADNPISDAYGLCQSLPGSKMASAGSDWATNPVTQMKWCNSYATSRYGSWANAYSFWISNHWW
ncbi:hypothetical protein RZE82_05650 [Mollicutes bacterium LVI A0039]|nr:hypothetical protein RZE82_05650 [Mollicutes bacterium LVI A0039]